MWETITLVLMTLTTLLLLRTVERLRRQVEILAKMTTSLSHQLAVFESRRTCRDE